jgi:hypothetical protein
MANINSGEGDSLDEKGFPKDLAHFKLHEF